MGGKPTTERAAEAKKFADLAKVYSEKAKHEDQLAGPTAMAFDRVGQPDDQDRHKMAAKEARDIAEEMQRRAYILTQGTEDNYRELVVDEYGINNPNLNEIMAYYAKKFNDQATLNHLKLQHPAAPPSPDQIRKDVGMLALLPQFEKMGAAAGESPLTEAPEKSIFDKTTDIAAGKAGSSGEHPGTETAEGTLPDAGGPGAAEKLIYEPNPKHPPAGSAAPGERSVAPQPTNPQDALDVSVPYDANSPGRVAVDPKSGEFVIFRPHAPGRYHGYAVAWDQLTQPQRNALIKSGQVNVRGKIL
jgi:hypothetical protein